MKQNETLKELLKLGYSKEQALFKLNDLIRFLKSKECNLKDFNNLTQIKKMFCELEF